MLKFFLRWPLFPLIGCALAICFLLSDGDNFKPEEIKFEPLTRQPEKGPTMTGLAELEWEGKKVLSLKEGQAFFSFSTHQRTSLVLQLKYYLKSPSEGEKIKLSINQSFLREVLLKPTLTIPNQLTVIIPFPLVQTRGNVLQITRSLPRPDPLYLEYLKIKNFQGYSTGLLEGYVLPLPNNPPTLSRLNWHSHQITYLFFIGGFSLFGIFYGFLLARRRQASFSDSLGKGCLVLFPALLLSLVITIIPLAFSGHLILTFKSFLLLYGSLICLAVAFQLQFIQPFLKSCNRLVQKSLQMKELVILFFVAVILLSVLFLFSLKFNRNITGFMVIGDYFEAPHIWTSKTLVHQGSVGYDGQFYYYIAHDPFILGHNFNHIDFPAYRYQRLIYPLTAWLLSLGQPTLIPYMMVAVNLLAILMGTYFIILILQLYGRNPWTSLFYATSWGFLLCLFRSMPEPLAITFIVMAIFAYLKGKTLWQMGFLTLAVLTQETTLLVSMAFFFYSFWKKEFRQSLTMLFPALAYWGWQLYIYGHFQTFSFLGGTQNFGLPFLGLIQKFFSLWQGDLSYEKAAEALYLVLILVHILTALYEVIHYYSPLTVSFLGYALLTSSLNQLIWVEPWSYARATVGLLVFNLLVFTKEGNRLNLFPMLFIPIIFLLSLFSMKLF
jgi:hypothetical protein